MLNKRHRGMNNAGSRPMYARKGARTVAAKENLNATRDRYTIRTYVPSWTPPAGMPPPVAVLFKANRGVRLARDLEHPGWMKIHIQEKGSYRAQDMVEALSWGIPPAAHSSESVVVLLDWFAAHLTPELLQGLRDMGHVVLHHGGGVTGLEQVNDTHLHALVQRLMEQLETNMMHRQHQACPEKLASLTRQHVVGIVTEMWQRIDHRNLRETGYRQTGPTLPEAAGLEDVSVDLRPVWETINGDALREEASRTVDQMWAAGILQSWTDVDQVSESNMCRIRPPKRDSKAWNGKSYQMTMWILTRTQTGAMKVVTAAPEMTPWAPVMQLPAARVVPAVQTVPVAPRALLAVLAVLRYWPVLEVGGSHSVPARLPPGRFQLGKMQVRQNGSVFARTRITWTHCDACRRWHGKPAKTSSCELCCRHCGGALRNEPARKPLRQSSFETQPESSVRQPSRLENTDESSSARLRGRTWKQILPSMMQSAWP